MQVQEFRELRDAGADLVTGVQSHVPQAQEPYGQNDAGGPGFISYGLGNLFFDQMWSWPTRTELATRHTFYDGRLLNTELLTMVLEDYAQPRWTAPEERADILQRVFGARHDARSKRSYAMNTIGMLTPRFETALEFACNAHRDDIRKGTQIPYLAHLLSVCALVLTDGGSEDEAIAALLHDTLEIMLKWCRAPTSKRAWSRACWPSSRAAPTPLPTIGAARDPLGRSASKPTWHTSAPPRIYGSPSPTSWTTRGRFRRLPADRRCALDAVECWQRGPAWYYPALVEAFRSAGVSGPLFEELERTVTELTKLSR